MNQTQFSSLLEIISKSTAEQLLSSEAVFYDLRAQSPDLFIDLIVTEIESTSKQSELACVLLRNDVENNSEKCALRRLQQLSFSEVIQRLLSRTAQRPTNNAAQLLAAIGLFQMMMNEVPDELCGFIEQALQENNADLQHRTLQIVVQLSAISQRLPFNPLEVAATFLKSDSDVLACAAIEIARAVLISQKKTKKLQGNAPAVIMSCLERTVQILSKPDDTKLAEAAIDHLSTMVEQAGNGLQSQLEQIVDLLAQIINSDLPETTRARAVYFFDSVCTGLQNIRKTHQKLIAGFVETCIIPHMCPSESQIQQWLEKQEEPDYWDASLKATSEDCISRLAQNLGTSVINPLIQKVFANAQTDEMRLAALNSIRFSVEEMSDILKDKDAKFYAQALVALLSSDNPRVRFDAVDTMTEVAEHLPQISQFCDAILPALLQMQEDPCLMVLQRLPHALIQFIAAIDYEQVFKYKQQLFDTVRRYFSSDQSQLHESGMLLLAELCNSFDEADITSLLEELMPQVLQQFAEIAQQVKNDESLDKSIVDYTTAVLDCLRQSIEVAPVLFAPIADSILQNLIILTGFALEQTNMSVFNVGMQCFSLAVDELKAAEKYVLPITEQITKCLKTDCMSVDVKITSEGEGHYDPNLNAMHTQALISLARLIAEYPKQFEEVFEDLYNIIRNFMAGLNDQGASKLDCLVEMLRIADQCDRSDYDTYNTDVLDFFVKNAISTDFENEDIELERQGDYADSLKAYVQIHVTRLHRLQLEITDPTVDKLLEILKALYEQSLKCFEQQRQEIFDEEQMDEDEKSAASTELVEELEKTIDALGGCLGAFLKILEEETPQQILTIIFDYIQLMLSYTESKEGAETLVVEALGILGDIAQMSSVDIARSAYTDDMTNRIYSEIVKQDADPVCQSSGFYAATRLMRKTRETFPFKCDEIMAAAAEILTNQVADKTPQQRQLFDHACGFMLLSGVIQQQSADYFKQVFVAAQNMVEDPQEIADFVSLVVENYEQYGCEQETMTVVIRLMFGMMWAGISKSSSNKSTIEKALKMMTKNPEMTQKIISESGEVVRKNVEAAVK